MPESAIIEIKKLVTEYVAAIKTGEPKGNQLSAYTYGKSKYIPKLTRKFKGCNT